MDFTKAQLEAMWAHVQTQEPVRDIRHLEVVRYGRSHSGVRGSLVVRTLELQGRVRYIPRCGWVVVFQDYAKRGAEIQANEDAAQGYAVREVQ